MCIITIQGLHIVATFILNGFNVTGVIGSIVFLIAVSQHVGCILIGVGAKVNVVDHFHSRHFIGCSIRCSVIVLFGGLVIQFGIVSVLIVAKISGVDIISRSGLFYDGKFTLVCLGIIKSAVFVVAVLEGLVRFVKVVGKGCAAVLVGRGESVDGIHTDGGISPAHFLRNFRSNTDNLIVILAPSGIVSRVSGNILVYRFGSDGCS